MITIRRTVHTSAAPATVFDYLADFTTTTEWDPGTIETTRISGDGGPGTQYANASRFLGRRTELTYVVVDLRPHEKVALRGHNTTVTAHDSMDIRPIESGSEVTYLATFEFNGLARLLEPILRPAFRRLGDRAQASMRDALDRRTA